MTPLVSLLIPAYNHQAYVQQTLDAIIHDDYPRKEIVIIDDGSVDDTDAVIRDWIRKHEAHITVKYRSRPNKGLTKTLNELLSLAEGEYLVAIASDDYLLPGGIRKRVDYLRAHPEKYAVFADCIVVDAQSRTVSQSALFDYRHADRSRLSSDAGIRREFLTNFAMPGPVLMVRRDFYTQFGGYDDEMYIEDYDLYLRFAAHDAIGFLDEKVSAYRIHDTNMSTVSAENYLRLLTDSRRTLLNHRGDFEGIEKLLLWQSVLKFSLRIAYHRLRRRFTPYSG